MAAYKQRGRVPKEVLDNIAVESNDNLCYKTGSDVASRNAKCQGDLACALAVSDHRKLGDCPQQVTAARAGKRHHSASSASVGVSTTAASSEDKDDMSDPMDTDRNGTLSWAELAKAAKSGLRLPGAFTDSTTPVRDQPFAGYAMAQWALPSASSGTLRQCEPTMAAAIPRTGSPAAPSTTFNPTRGCAAGDQHDDPRSWNYEPQAPQSPSATMSASKRMQVHQFLRALPSPSDMDAPDMGIVQIDGDVPAAQVLSIDQIDELEREILNLQTTSEGQLVQFVDEWPAGVPPHMAMATVVNEGSAICKVIADKRTSKKALLYAVFQRVGLDRALSEALLASSNPELQSQPLLAADIFDIGACGDHLRGTRPSEPEAKRRRIAAIKSELSLEEVLELWDSC